MLKPIKRAVHFDFHTMPGIDNFGERFDAEKFAEQLDKAHVKYINMFARCNIGFSYYPTKIGIPYKGLKENMLGNVVRECHKRGIGVTGYVNGGLNHELMLKNPGWQKVNRNGQVWDMSCGGNFFRTLCFNSDYRAYLIKEIKEILNEGVDGIFIDCLASSPCLCPTCTKMMKERGIDINDDKAVELFSEDTIDSLGKDLRAAVPDDKYLILNGMPVQLTAKSHIEVECLPAAWSYDFFPAKVALARTQSDFYMYMNGRFQRSWADFGGYKGKAAIENDFYDAIMNGATTSLGDHLHPADIAESEIYKDLEQIYAWVESLEEYTDGAQYESEIAVMYTNRYVGTEHHGAARILSELKYGFDIVTPQNDLSKYKVLILPESNPIDEELAKKISEYLSAGGKVIAFGDAAVNKEKDGFVMDEFDFEFAGIDTHTDPYFKLNKNPEGHADMIYNGYVAGILMKKSEKTKSIADYYESYFDKHFDGMHYYFYNPPRKVATNLSAISINSKENVCQVCFSLFRSYYNSMSTINKQIVKDILEMFYPEKLIVADQLPQTSRVTVTAGDGYKLLHVKVTYPEIRGKLGIVEEHNELPGGKKISVKGRFDFAKCLPDGEILQTEYKDGYTEITLSKIVGYEIILLK